MWKIGTQTWIHTYLFFFDYFSRTLAHLISQCVWVYHLKYFRILIIKNSCKEEKKKKKKKRSLSHQQNRLKWTNSKQCALESDSQLSTAERRDTYFHCMCVCGCKTRVVCFRRSCACWFSLNSAFELINQSAKYMQAADSDSMGWNQLLDLYWFLNAIHLCT